VLHSLHVNTGRRPPPSFRAHRWLVFIHQLPAQPSNGRVKIWRRLQQIGAVPVKNAVHVLPNNAQAREDFEWLRTEVVALGGDATIFAASSIKGLDERRMKLAGESRKDARGAGDQPVAPRAAGPVKPVKPVTLDRKAFRGKVWITRPRPGVDRFSSAWLIRRFIDADARFVFGSSPGKAPDAVPFDMYQPGGFRHHGDRCTFEVLCERFALDDAALRRIGEIVHDLDLKDDRFKNPHAATIGMLVDGLRASFADDPTLLEQGIVLFETLYHSFQAGTGIRGGKPRIC
jgi:hypothetical protein